MSGASITLAGTMLRASAFHLMGSIIGSVSPDQIGGILFRLFQATVTTKFVIGTKPMPLGRIEEAWTSGEMDRIVLISPAS